MWSSPPPPLQGAPRTPHGSTADVGMALGQPIRRQRARHSEAARLPEAASSRLPEPPRPQQRCGGPGNEPAAPKRAPPGGCSPGAGGIPALAWGAASSLARERSYSQEGGYGGASHGRNGGSNLSSLLPQLCPAVREENIQVGWPPHGALSPASGCAHDDLMFSDVPPLGGARASVGVGGALPPATTAAVQSGSPRLVLHRSSIGAGASDQRRLPPLSHAFNSYEVEAATPCTPCNDEASEASASTVASESGEWDEQEIVYCCAPPRQVVEVKPEPPSTPLPWATSLEGDDDVSPLARRASAWPTPYACAVPVVPPITFILAQDVAPPVDPPGVGRFERCHGLSWEEASGTPLRREWRVADVAAEPGGPEMNDDQK